MGIVEICEEWLVEKKIFTFTRRNVMFFPIFVAIAIVPVETGYIRKIGCFHNVYTGYIHYDVESRLFFCPESAMNAPRIRAFGGNPRIHVTTNAHSGYDEFASSGAFTAHKKTAPNGAVFEMYENYCTKLQGFVGYANTETPDALLKFGVAKLGDFF